MGAVGSRKIIATFAVVAFLWVGLAWSSDSSPSFQEKEGKPIVHNHKRFPWIWVAAGAIAVGVIVYFIVKKTPEYKLTVELDDSASGSPGAGVTTYKKGQTASYEYTPRPGFDTLTVLLDGVQVKSSGSFKMVRDHTLKVSARPITYTLTVELGAGVTGTPPAGTTTRAWQEQVPYSYAVADGYQDLKVLLDGAEVPATGTILMDRDHTLEAKVPIEGSRWDFTYQSSKRGTIHTMLIFFKPVPPYTQGAIIATGGNWDLVSTGAWAIYANDDNYFKMYFQSNHDIYIFDGHVSDSDLLNIFHMSGDYSMLYGDPGRLEDWGSWSAWRL